jgi:hypothetical protein
MVLVHKIGLDIDKTLDPEVTHKKILRYKHLVERYNIYISASGKGLHFELFLKKPVSIGESFKIRENLGDDPKRIMFSKADFSRGWDFDILFTYKKIWNPKTKKWEWKKRRFLEEVIL